MGDIVHVFCGSGGGVVECTLPDDVGAVVVRSVQPPAPLFRSLAETCGAKTFV